MTGQKAIVTGAAGFIGRTVVSQLVNGGFEVVAIDRPGGLPATTRADISWVLEDLLETDAVHSLFSGATVLFHCAGVADQHLSGEHYHAANVQTTIAALEIAQRNGIPRFIYPSSAAVYGQGPYPAHEDQRRAPDNPYAVSKAVTEDLVRIWSEWFGIETVGFRIFNGYGPGGEHLGVVGAFLKRLRAGQPVVLSGGGTQLRDFVHVTDIAAAMILAATAKNPSPIYNLASGEPKSVKELAEIMNAPTDCAPARPDDPELRTGDVTRVHTELGWSPRVELEDGITALFDQPID